MKTFFIIASWSQITFLVTLDKEENGFLWNLKGLEKVNAVHNRFKTLLHPLSLGDAADSLSCANSQQKEKKLDI